MAPALSRSAQFDRRYALAPKEAPAHMATHTDTTSSLRHTADDLAKRPDWIARLAFDLCHAMENALSPTHMQASSGYTSGQRRETFQLPLQCDSAVQRTCHAESFRSDSIVDAARALATASLGFARALWLSTKRPPRAS